MEKFYDNYIGRFSEEQHYFSAVESDNGEWVKANTASLHVIPLERMPMEADLVKEELAIDASQGAIADTLENTRLALEIPGRGIQLLRTSAIRSLLERAKINGTALGKISKKDLAKTLNSCLSVWNKESTLCLLKDEKVSSCMSGNKGEYAPMDKHDLAQSLKSALNGRFDGHVFNGAVLTHELLVADYSFPNQHDLFVKSYADICKRDLSNYEMALRFTTSDTGVSGANLTCALKSPGLTLPLGIAYKLKHIGNACVEDFAKNANTIYAKTKNATFALLRLRETVISHPATCMVAVAKKIGLPRKAVSEAVALYEATRSSRFATAHDLYWALCETQNFVDRGVNLFALHEKLARALYVKWENYDYAVESAA